jgi:hypothetical protein
MSLAQTMPAIILGLCPLLPAAEAHRVETSLGMEGSYYLRAEGPLLEAKPVDEKSPLELRIAGMARDRGAFIYQLRFIGLRPGLHDLRAFLRRADGGEAPALEPILVLVKENLPPDHRGDLERFTGPALARPWPLRPWIWAGAGLWTLPVLWSLGRRLTRAGRRPRDAPSPRPTPAGEIRPLVEAAIGGRLSPGGKARLERLLLALWRCRLGLAGAAPREALRRMREDGEAGLLLGRLEDWLHRRPGSETVRLEELLAPYQSEAPEVAPALSGEAGP